MVGFSEVSNNNSRKNYIDDRTTGDLQNDFLESLFSKPQSVAIKHLQNTTDSNLWLEQQKKRNKPTWAKGYDINPPQTAGDDFASETSADELRARVHSILDKSIKKPCDSAKQPLTEQEKEQQDALEKIYAGTFKVGDPNVKIKPCKAELPSDTQIIPKKATPRPKSSPPVEQKQIQHKSLWDQFWSWFVSLFCCWKANSEN